MSDINDTKKTSLDLLPAVAMLACAVWFFFLISILILVHCSSAITIDKVGSLGDSFGILNALVTTLTLIGLLYTMRQQQAEIEHNKQEAIHRKQESEIQTQLGRLTARLNALPSLIEMERSRCNGLRQKADYIIAASKYEVVQKLVESERNLKANQDMVDTYQLMTDSERQALSQEHRSGILRSIRMVQLNKSLVKLLKYLHELERVDALLSEGMTNFNLKATDEETLDAENQVLE